MRTARFRPRDDSLSWVAGKTTKAGTLKLEPPGKQGLLFKGFPDHDHRVALTVDFS
jgi:hypothetical protein